MKDTKFLLILLLAIVVAGAGYYLFTAPDNRSAGEKIGDAISNLDEGVDDAARELEDRTPAERIKDEVNDATDGSPE